ncbi:MAG: hypothetical protein HY548_01145 [Elusimicrobia bacterium]|nr:hypothetical protein [Elusimicrobiota bacterium]
MNPFYLLVLLLMTIAPLAFAENNAVVFQITEGLAQPESAYFHPETNQIFISNIAGSPDGKDLTGWILKADSSGKVVQQRWIDGLNAPKGMRAFGEKLYVSDINEVVVIDVGAGRILQKIAVPGSRFLNDVAVDLQGNVYVSDSLANVVFRVDPAGRASPFAQGKELGSPNGLLVQGGKLLVACQAAGQILSIDLASGQKVPRTRHALGVLDGLEVMANGDLLLSDWSNGGRIYKIVRATNGTEILLQGFQGPADIGLIPDQNVLLVPEMQTNKLTAYTLQR